MGIYVINPGHFMAFGVGFVGSPGSPTNITPSIVFFTFYLYFDVILHFTFSVNEGKIWKREKTNIEKWR